MKCPHFKEIIWGLITVAVLSSTLYPQTDELDTVSQQVAKLTASDIPALTQRAEA